MKRITKIEEMIVGHWYHFTPKKATLCGIYQLSNICFYANTICFENEWFDFDSFSSIFEVPVE